MRLPGLVASLLIVAPPMTAFAHLGLTSPESRWGRDVLKNGPCGMAGGTRSDNVATFRPGETITIEWNEYVDHPGHFRISFDDDGDDDFVDPACTAGCDTRNPTVEMYSNSTVLLDGIPDRAGGDYAIEVTLPNVTCTNCTLQVLQVMYDKPPYTLPGNEMYYQCIDLVLDPDAAANDGGCVCVGRSHREHPGLLMGGVVLLIAMAASRRRRCRARAFNR